MGKHTQGRVWWIILSGCDRVKGFLENTGWQELLKKRIAEAARTVPEHIMLCMYPEESGMSLVIYTNDKPRLDKIVKLIQRIVEPMNLDVREAGRKYVLCKRGTE